MGRLRAMQEKQGGEQEGGGPTAESTMDSLGQDMGQLEQLVGKIYRSVKQLAPQLEPLIVPIVQGGKALSAELQKMKTGGGQQEGTGRSAPGANLPGSVLAA